jgi:hypothetical protein
VRGRPPLPLSRAVRADAALLRRNAEGARTTRSASGVLRDQPRPRRRVRDRSRSASGDLRTAVHQRP